MVARFAALLALAALVLSTPADAQSCRWDGTAPICAGRCNSNEQELTRLGSIPDFWVPPFVVSNPPFGSNCVTGSKALCCASRAAGTGGGGCRWDGTAPFCEGACRSNEVRATPPAGSSSGATCVTGSKVYCCPRVGSVSQPLVVRNCASGPGTCAQGFVWREAAPHDRVCVLPRMRSLTRADNAQAGARRNPGGGAFGPDTCRSGFVWREAFNGDRVCVTPQRRAQVAQDNRWAQVRNACP